MLPSHFAPSLAMWRSWGRDTRAVKRRALRGGSGVECNGRSNHQEFGQLNDRGPRAGVDSAVECCRAYSDTGSGLDGSAPERWQRKQRTGLNFLNAIHTLLAIVSLKPSARGALKSYPRPNGPLKLNFFLAPVDCFEANDISCRAIR
jgi:hypothetical protein